MVRTVGATDVFHEHKAHGRRQRMKLPPKGEVDKFPLKWFY